MANIINLINYEYFKDFKKIFIKYIFQMVLLHQIHSINFRNTFKHRQSLVLYNCYP